MPNKITINKDLILKRIIFLLNKIIYNEGLIDQEDNLDNLKDEIRFLKGLLENK